MDAFSWPCPWEYASKVQAQVGWSLPDWSARSCCILIEESLEESLLSELDEEETSKLSLSLSLLGTFESSPRMRLSREDAETFEQRLQYICVCGLVVFLCMSPFVWFWAHTMPALTTTIWGRHCMKLPSQYYSRPLQGILGLHLTAVNDFKSKEA